MSVTMRENLYVHDNLFLCKETNGWKESNNSTAYGYPP
jgi:hypothetical protein